MNPWLAGSAAIAVLAAAVGGYLEGKSAGVHQEEAAELKREREQQLSAERMQRSIDEYERASAQREAGRQAEVRYVYREVPRVVAGSPVYRNGCLDAAGIELLDRAAASANSEGGAATPGRSAEAAGSAANDGSGNRQSDR
ncbi:hypothetical protein [Sphingomonas ginkgonis]|uniref:hypothetical protein n=1 Tax=Sphingomonas ginkgonis TaxID=2315330 RepID=UPI00163B514E|nr:hypothetical protein [Sphingomonas ginkgonis]